MSACVALACCLAGILAIVFGVYGRSGNPQPEGEQSRSKRQRKSRCHGTDGDRNLSTGEGAMHDENRIDRRHRGWC